MEVLDRQQSITGAPLMKRVAADTGITDLSNIDKVRRLPSAVHR